jgi:hypothetical protein
MAAEEGKKYLHPGSLTESNGIPENYILGLASSSPT